MTRSVELKLYAYRKNRDGLIVSFVVHPNDEDFLNGIHIGQVYQAELQPETDGPTETIKKGAALLDDLRTGKTEGERLRTRAVLLCKDRQFQEWLEAGDLWQPDVREDYSKQILYQKCGIASRSELATNKAAQEKFLALERQYREETGQAAEWRGG